VERNSTEINHTAARNIPRQACTIWCDPMYQANLRAQAKPHATAGALCTGPAHQQQRQRQRAPVQRPPSRTHAAPAVQVQPAEGSLRAGAGRPAHHHRRLAASREVRRACDLRGTAELVGGGWEGCVKGAGGTLVLVCELLLRCAALRWVYGTTPTLEQHHQGRAVSSIHRLTSSSYRGDGHTYQGNIKPTEPVGAGETGEKHIETQ